MRRDETTATLNEEQERAVTFDDHNLLIVAGPGTGKTHTLTHRVAHRLGHLDSSQRALIITFTRKAAEELQQRLAHLHCDLDRLYVGTFHAWCHDLLRDYSDRLDLPMDFLVASPEEIEGRVSEIWPDADAAQRKARYAFVKEYKGRGTAPAGQDEIVIHAYDTWIRARGWVDYDDLLLLAGRLLQQHDDVRRDVRLRWKEIYVDEYQDLNPAQHTLLVQLVGKDQTISVIGDPNQAIYGFRGSALSAFHSFEEDFAPASRLELMTNYRCAQYILQASSQVIRAGNQKVPAITAALYEKGDLVIHAAASEKAEAIYVAHAIEGLVGGMSSYAHDSGMVSSQDSARAGFGDIAVLYRLNAQRRVIEKALDHQGIPYHVAGSKSHLQDPGLDRKIERVHLLTMHAAKGLEFPIVFVTGCEDGLLPLSLAGMRSDEHEERRLFYVAMTRGKQRVYFVRAQRRFVYGRRYELAVSPFLEDIDEALKTRLASTPRKRSPKKRDVQGELFVW